MTTMIDPDIMSGREIHDAEQAEYIDLLHESLFTVQAAAADLARAHGLLAAGELVVATKTIGDIRLKLHYALSSVDLDAASQLTPPTATCPTCFDLRYYYPSGDPADEPVACSRCATPPTT